MEKKLTPTPRRDAYDLRAASFNAAVLGRKLEVLADELDLRDGFEEPAALEQAAMLADRIAANLRDVYSRRTGLGIDPLKRPGEPTAYQLIESTCRVLEAWRDTRHDELGKMGEALGRLEAGSEQHPSISHETTREFLADVAEFWWMAFAGPGEPRPAAFWHEGPGRKVVEK